MKHITPQTAISKAAVNRIDGIIHEVDMLSFLEVATDIIDEIVADGFDSEDAIEYLCHLLKRLPYE